MAEVFEMTPFFPTSGQKNDCTCSYFKNLALIKAQLEKLSNKTKTRDKIEFGKNVESGQFEMNFASHKTLVQRNKSIDLCIRRVVILWQALLKRCLIYHYKIPDLKCMISHIRHYIKHIR